jgi:hypothetical protein
MKNAIDMSIFRLWLSFWLLIFSWQGAGPSNHVSVSAVEITNHHSSNSSKLPIVYVYTVVPAMCHRGLPDYLKISIEQALLSQPDCDVIMATNYAQCPHLSKLMDNIPNVVLIDTAELTTARVKEFSTLAMDVFQTDNRGELWITSALRFFLMEEIMLKMNYTEMLHVEGDNMLYGRITSILPTLRQSYKGLAATPLFANKVFITASVFWIADLPSIQKFNHFLYEVALRNTTYTAYLRWIRRYACCKRGGIDPDANGNGIKPFAVNEMSMLGYYHVLYPDDFKAFPVVPQQPFNLNKHVVNMSDYGPGGRQVGDPTANAIWDPNSWGQYHGGTSHKRGRDKGFKDPDHVVGQAIRTTGCNITMECSPQANEDISYPLNNTPFYVTNKWVQRCLTAPYVICNGGSFTRLWNLHVHSKHTHHYMSQACDCSTAIK